MMSARNVRVGFRRAVWLIPLLFCSCQWFGHREIPPLQLPAADVQAWVFAGTVLSGELPQSINDDAAKQAWAVSLHAVAVKTLPAEGFSPIGPYSKLVL